MKKVIISFLLLFPLVNSVGYLVSKNLEKSALYSQRHISHFWVGFGSLHAQNTNWQWTNIEGGSRNTLNNDQVDDNVLKIIPAIENDGSFIVVSKLMQTDFNDYGLYFDDTLIIQQDLVPSNPNSTLVIAKHDCDGNPIKVKQIEDIPFYNNRSIEGFQDMVKINNKYYLFANVSIEGNDSAIVLDTVLTEPIVTMLLVLNEDLTIDTMRYNTGPLKAIAPYTVSVGPDKNMYFITGLREDSANFYNGDVALIHKGLSFVKMDTFGQVLDVHRLTDTVYIWEGFMCGIDDLFVGDDYYLISGWVWNNNVINGISLEVFPPYYGGFSMKINKNTHQTIWYKQPEQYSGRMSTSSVIFIRDSILNIRGLAERPPFVNQGLIYDGDTVKTTEISDFQCPIKIDPSNGNKINLSYSQTGGSKINNSFINNNTLYLNIRYINMKWQNLDIPTEPLDSYTGSQVIKNGIFKYNINSGVVDTVTNYKFTHFSTNTSNTTSMVKIGDNFIVGGHVGTYGYFGNDTIEDYGGNGGSLFFAKYGSSQCVFCDSAKASFTLNIDTFSISLSNTSLNADSHTWLIDDSISISTNLSNYQFADTGTHKICLIVENTCSVDTFCQTINISCNLPQALLMATQEGFIVSVSNNSLLANEYSINWGDGTVNNSLSHQYESVGGYEICLSVSNHCGVDTACVAIEIITGIQEQYSNDFVVKMFPNPAKDEILLSWQNIENKQKSIEIYTIFGQKIEAFEIKNNFHKSQKVSLKNYTKGVYFVVLKLEGRIIWSEKLMVE